MAAGKKNQSSSSSLLAPGFRFHPTDEELVRYYLRRKVCGKGFLFDAISDIDIYKIEPWDLPVFSRLKTRDLEWYFFSMLDKKYGNGARTNRATEKGYWKTTGKDRSVYHKSQTVGMKKTLVFHIGRAPKGQRSNWVMHEYRLTDLELEKAGIAQDAFVLCRVFQKSGSGPKNGERYGAPFVEDDWEKDDVELVQKSEVVEVVDSVDDDFCLNCDDLEQILGLDVLSEASPLPLNSQPPDVKLNEGTAESVDDTSIIFTNAVDQYCEMDSSVVKHQYIRESSKSQDNPSDLDFLLDETFIDALDGLPFENTGFLESNDLMKPIETNDSSLGMLEEYLTFFDANDNTQFVFDQEMLLPTEELNAGVKDDFGTVIPSDKNLDSAKYKSDVEYPIFEKASHMLGNIPAPPAFAAEFPSKDAVLRLNLNTDATRSAENFNIVVSFGFSKGKAKVESSLRILERKAVAAVSRCWVYFMLLWIVILSVSFKIGICICAK